MARKKVVAFAMTAKIIPMVLIARNVDHTTTDQQECQSHQEMHANVSVVNYLIRLEYC